jgi:tetrahydromethanopterin S-methyltransferase subunit B
MFNSIRRYPKLEKAKREELETKLRDEIAPLLVESAGLHVFAVSDEEGVITSMTVYESETAAQLAAKRAPVDSSIPQLKPEETSVEELPGRGGVKQDAEHQRGQRKGS